MHEREQNTPFTNNFLYLPIWLFYVLSLLLELICLKKLIYILRLNKFKMYKFGFNFFKIIFPFAPCMGQSEIIPWQTGLNKKKDKRYNKFYFLKLKLIHKHHCYL